MPKTFWLLSAGLAAIATPAYAQDEPTTPDEPPTTPSLTEQAAVDDTAQAEGQNIVVTAQGRRQILQDVPSPSPRSAASSCRTAARPTSAS